MQLNGIEYADILKALKKSGFPQKMITDDHSEKCWVIRHDIDNHIQRAQAMALQESAHGVRSTYYLLDYDSGIPEENNYFYKEESKRLYQDIQECSHHIGWHNNAITHWLKEPFDSLHSYIEKPIEYLRSLGIEVLSTASHGDRLCREHNYVNYEVWKSFEKKSILAHERYNLLDFGLMTEAYLMKRSHYLSDSGGVFNYEDPIAYIKTWAAHGKGNLQLLIHSQWWE